MPQKSKTPYWQFQVRFFEELKLLAPPHAQFADYIAEILKVSLDSAYRRIRGETEIGLNEAFTLCNEFNYPLSGLNAGIPHLVTFYVNHLGEKMDSFDHYILNLSNEVKRIAKSPDGFITYAAEDIPIFYQFSHKNLLYFKMFYWMKAIQSVEDLPGETYHPQMFDRFYENKGKALYQLYAKTPSAEIWTPNTLLSTLNQIKFYWESRYITEEKHLIMILDDLKSMLDIVKKQADTGFKHEALDEEKPIPYQLYLSSLLIATNSTLVTRDGNTLCYLGYNTFNSIKTTNEFFARETTKWFNNLIVKSTPISAQNESKRHQFFYQLYKDIDVFKRQLLH
jgi:hypothetical protein